MPTEIHGFDEIDDAAFEQMLREARKSNPSYLHPSMVALMEALASSDRPILIRVPETQLERTVRSAIANVARHRGMRIQAVSGSGVVAVKRLGFIEEEREEETSG